MMYYLFLNLRHQMMMLGPVIVLYDLAYCPCCTIIIHPKIVTDINFLMLLSGELNIVIIGPVYP